MAAQFAEMDDRVTFLQQLQQDAGPVVLINKFNVAAEDADRLLQAWADDTAFMKQQPGHLDPAPPRAARFGSPIPSARQARGRAFFAASRSRRTCSSSLLRWRYSSH